MTYIRTNRMRSRRWKPVVKYNLKQHLTAKQLKQRNNLFKNVNIKVVTNDYARYSWATPAQVIKAMCLGYLDPNDRQNFSPIQLRFIKFVLQNKGKARFYFHGYLHSTYGKEDIVIDTFVMVPFKKYRDTMIPKFMAFSRTCSELKITAGNDYISAWWD